MLFDRSHYNITWRLYQTGLETSPRVTARGKILRCWHDHICWVSATANPAKIHV